MTAIAAEYAESAITVRPGDRLHRLIATLCDTYYDDLTDERLAELQAVAESWRWMNADGMRLR